MKPEAKPEALWFFKDNGRWFVKLTSGKTVQVASRKAARLNFTYNLDAKEEGKP